MANVEHKDIDDPYIHEPKGIGAATAGKVYISDGAGSGTWTTLHSKQVVLNIHFDDLSTAASHYIVSPVAGTISKIYSVLDAAIATADTVLTFKLGGVAITDGTITIAYSGSAAGDVDSCTPSALNTVSAGDAIEVAGDGGTTTSSAHSHISIVVDVS